MSAAQNLVGKVLRGARGGAEWQVLEKVNLRPGVTPGAFSVGYVAESNSGQKAFLKASDLGMFTRDGESFLEGLQRAVNAHAFERQILDHCHGNNMDRVVTALDYGDTEVFYHGTRDTVFFLVFEKADGDLRKHVESEQAADLLWCATALHNFFIAVAQLHGALIAHNDIKPGNALVFDKDLQKLGDLGRATSTLIPAPHDAFQCAGDSRFAPPEQLYPIDLNCSHLPMETRRFAGDLYNLGSITHYMITARMITPEIISGLRPEFRPRNMAGGSHDSYQAALPYWRTVFDSILAEARGAASVEFGDGVAREIDFLLSIICELCEPDPLRRGHPANRTGAQNPFGLERYISGLARTKERLAIKAA
jgi:serine/threonine protein kinase